MIEVTCQTCGATFAARADKKRVYCSQECAGKARRRAPRACTECGKEYMPVHGAQRYCSHTCAMIATHQHRRQSGQYPARVSVTCERCGVPFWVRQCNVVNVTNGSRRRFCSDTCRAAAVGEGNNLHGANLADYACQECGKAFRDKPSMRHRKKYCSRECLGVACTRRNLAQSPTSIEVETYAALTELGIAFERQYRIGRWVTDAYIPSLNTVIECQGDFYHCNPAVFPDGPKSVIQHRGVTRDRQKFADLQSKGYRVIELWEQDIQSIGALALLQQALG
jgi:G:T-mismatch repair DNA endonuclease (very short patch repair protein)